MRILSAVALAFLIPFLASGCGSGGEKDPEDGTKGSIQSPKDLKQQQKRVLELLRYFEEHDMGHMDAAVVELEEMAASEQHLVSDEISAQLKLYHSRATANDAIDRLRWISKFVRTLSLLDTNDKESWAHCRDVMYRMGPEATVRFAGVLIVKYTDNPPWCRTMLMDLCVKGGNLVQDALFEAVNFAGTEQNTVLTRRVMDDSTRKGLSAALLFLPDPPVAKIRDSAVRGPIGARRAWAEILPSLKMKGARPGQETIEPWAGDLLAVQLAADPAWQVRMSAAESLGECGTPDVAVKPLIKALKDVDPAVRRIVCKSLGIYGPTVSSALDPLIQMLRGLDTEIFEYEKEGKTIRAPLAGNPRRELEDNALVALQRITGKRLLEIGSFIAWWDEQRR